MTRWLIAAVLIAPLAVFPASWGLSSFQSKNAVFILLGLCVAFAMTPNRWVQAWLWWAGVGYVLSGAREWGTLGLLGVLAWALVYQAASRLTATAWRNLRLAITAAACFQVAWMVLQGLGRDPVFSAVSYTGQVTAERVPPVGWFANPTDTALFLSVALPSVLIVHPLLGGVVAAALLVALKSTAGFVGIAVAALWLAVRKDRRSGVIAAGLLGVVALIHFVRLDPQGLGSRPMLWQHVASLVALKPIAGWGLNAYGNRLTTFSVFDEQFDYVHSDYLQGALEVGLIGLGLALLYLATTAWRLRLRWREAGESVAVLATLAVVAVFSHPLHIGPVALLAALHLGYLERGLTA